MRIFVINDLYFKGNHAGYKARQDVFDILKSSYAEEIRIYNFYRLKLTNIKSKLLHNILLHLKLTVNYILFYFFAGTLKKGDVVFIQFPFGAHFPLSLKIYKMLKKYADKNKIRIVMLIHDLNSLRSEDEIEIDAECKILDMADFIISHNAAMSEWLSRHGTKKGKLVELKIFDYLFRATTENNDQGRTSEEKKIVFAGNLRRDKTSFLYDWNPDFTVDLYGINFDDSVAEKHLNYKGVFDADNPVIDSYGILFGLVWDGTSVMTCEGVNGNYIRYNNPHKASLYLSLGLPVIVWKESALATWVEEKEIGYTVESLYDISDMLNAITAEQYRALKKNVEIMGSELRGGMSFKKAFDTCLLKMGE